MRMKQINFIGNTSSSSSSSSGFLVWHK